MNEIIKPNGEETNHYGNNAHRARHIELHKALDELIACMISQTKMLPSTTTVMELMKWSHEQCVKGEVRR